MSHILPGMRFTQAIAVIFLWFGSLCLGQSGASEEREPVSVIQLPPPDYPPMALAARVTGEVRLRIVLNPDGTPQSAEAENGPPMLLEQAVELVRKARFACEQCDKTNSLEITMRFEFGKSICPDQPRDPNYPHASATGSVITIATQPFMLCDPAASIGVRIRSIRCLYLWRCAIKAE